MIAVGHHVRCVQPSAVPSVASARLRCFDQRPEPLLRSLVRRGCHRSNCRAPAASPGSTENGVDRLPVVESGGGSGGIGNNGSGGGGAGGEGGGGSPGSSGNLWSLLAVATAALAIFRVYRIATQAGSSGKGPLGTQKQGFPEGEDGSEDSEVAALKRLVREAFSDLVKVRARLEELEDVTGIVSEEGPPLAAGEDAGSAAATPLVGSEGTTGGRRGRGPAVVSASAAKHTRHHLGVLSGNLELGGGVLWAPEEVYPGELLPAAGVRLGADLALKMRGSARGGKDTVQAECKLNPSTEQFSLKKVLYYCQLAPALRLALAPFGATGQDTAYTLNPLAGQGLCAMVKHGSPLHQRPLGSLMGASLDLKHAWASAGYSLQGLESGGLRTAVLGQALVAASSTLSLGVSALQQRAAQDADAGVAAAAPGTTPRPAPAITPRGGILPSPRPASGLTPRTGGITPRTPGLAAVWEGTPGLPAGGPAAGTAAGTQLAAMFAWRPDPDVVVHGWAAADSDALRQSVRSRGLRGVQPEQWGVSVGSYPDGTGNGWAVGLGRSSAVAAAAGGGSSGSGDGNGNGAPNLFELSLQFGMGEGMLVTPGVLCAVHGGRTTLFAGLKTTWDW